jgi:histidinol-phosphate aminotransferase
MSPSQTQPAFLANIPQYVQEAQPYKPGKPLEEIKQEYGLERIIKVASNENPWGPSPLALKAMQAVEKDLFRYPDPISRRLKQKLASQFGVQEEELIVGAGSESLLGIAIRTLMKPGDVALSGEGAFLGFKVHLASHGGVLKTVPSPSYRFDIDAMIHAITPDVKLVYLPNPNNPTGSYITQTELDKILAALPDSTLLILDEAYVEFCSHFPDFPNSLKSRKDNVLILRTFSKAYGLGGLRVGYGIGHPQLIEQMGKVKMTFEVTLLSQVAAEAALEDTEHLKRTVESNLDELPRFYQFFESKNIPFVKSCGNFVLFELASEQAVEDLNLSLLKKGIAIRPLKAFGFPQCGRISIGTPDENTEVLAALNENL